jgi:hypothetical protein
VSDQTSDRRPLKRKFARNLFDATVPRKIDIVYQDPHTGHEVDVRLQSSAGKAKELGRIEVVIPDTNQPVASVEITYQYKVGIGDDWATATVQGYVSERQTFADATTFMVPFRESGSIKRAYGRDLSAVQHGLDVPVDAITQVRVTRVAWEDGYYGLVEHCPRIDGQPAHHFVDGQETNLLALARARSAADAHGSIG